MRTPLPFVSLPSSCSGMLPTGNDGRSRFAAGSSPNAVLADTTKTSIAHSAGLRMERGSGEIFLATRTGHHVVLDAHAAKVLEFRHSFPVDHFSDGPGLRFVQQLIDEVETRLHSYDESVLEPAREPQERMVVRPLNLLAVGRALCAADVMHL